MPASVGRYFNAGDDEAAPAASKVIKGLVRRRETELRLYRPENPADGWYQIFASPLTEGVDFLKA